MKFKIVAELRHQGRRIWGAVSCLHEVVVWHWCVEGAVSGAGVSLTVRAPTWHHPTGFDPQMKVAVVVAGHLFSKFAHAMFISKRFFWVLLSFSWKSTRLQPAAAPPVKNFIELRKKNSISFKKGLPFCCFNKQTAKRMPFLNILFLVCLEKAGSSQHSSSVVFIYACIIVQVREGQSMQRSGKAPALGPQESKGQNWKFYLISKARYTLNLTVKSHNLESTQTRKVELSGEMKWWEFQKWF